MKWRLKKKETEKQNLKKLSGVELLFNTYIN